MYIHQLQISVNPRQVLSEILSIPMYRGRNVVVPTRSARKITGNWHPLLMNVIILCMEVFDRFCLPACGVTGVPATDDADITKRLPFFVRTVLAVICARCFTDFETAWGQHLVVTEPTSSPDPDDVNITKRLHSLRAHRPCRNLSPSQRF